ncbi:UDP-N-acetylmuramoyl-L-alanine--D-glutamate ligase, partial [Candidatus Beckwithbacteria bacterium]|nr:UDP-N-acetylmuramoyl-L-alanine--D-glutamate ligase [Candidatus Beckwithbacteria bacterium]
MDQNLSSYIESLHNKKVLIFGLGLQGGGLDAALFFAKHAKAVKITDLKTAEQLQATLAQLEEKQFNYRFGGHSLEDIDWADLIIVNPDIWNKKEALKYLEYARENKKDIETSVSIFLKYCPCQTIGVTGSRGKTTTAQAIFTMLTACSKKTILAGNIPNCMTLQQLEKSEDYDFAVLELSNFQLHSLEVSPHIAIITSISPDHLLSYQSMDEYLLDKRRITAFQRGADWLLLNQDD